MEPARHASAGFAAFGQALADDSPRRCGLVEGADAGRLRPVLQAATQLTSLRDPVDGTVHGLTGRPLLPGDGNPCDALV